MTNITVIGAGVIGLSTAINIQQCMPEAHVTLVADKFNQYTTSDGAGGLVVPEAPGIDDVTRRRWGVVSMDHFTKMAVSEDSAECGAYLSMGILCQQTPELPSYSDLMLTFTPIPRDTVEKLGLGNYKYCFTMTTVLVEGRRYLPYLMRRFKKNGGFVIKKKVHSLSEFVDACDLVVNCSGLGSRELVDDKTLVPLRGQLLRVSAPWIKHFVYIEDETYGSCLPNCDNVSLGSVKQPDNPSLVVEPETSEKIWTNITTTWPPIKPARLLWEWVGFRPYRKPLRVEKELVRYGDKTLKVVHNYGHGSSGVSLSWGTAVHAADLVRKLLTPAARL